MSNAVEKVQEALAIIRPFLQKDGGDVEFVSIENSKVFIKLLGACKTCSISHITMKAGVEESIKKALPEITEVLAVD